MADHSLVAVEDIQRTINVQVDSFKPDYWSDKISQAFRTRTFFDTLNKYSVSTDEQIDTVISLCVNELASISGPTRRNAISSKDLILKTYESIESVATGETISGITTGFDVIDDQIGGLPAKVVTIVGARTSIGKTALCLDMMLGATRNGFPVTYYSAEDEQVNIGRRLLAKVSGVNLSKLKKATNLTYDEWAMLSPASNELQSLPYSINDRMYSSVDRLVSDMRYDVRANGTKVVFIDYVQLLRLGRKSGNRDQELNEIGIMFKQAAKDLGIAIVLLSQMRRQRNDESERPSISQLRDSGTLEQHAHLILLLHRNKEKTDGVTDVIVGKNKDGPIGTKHLIFEAKTARYRDAKLDEIMKFHS